MSQLLGTICSAFVGLCVTFMLNTAKTERDKKNHLIAVLHRYQSDINYYRIWFNPVNTTIKQADVNTAYGVFLKGLKTHPYPYFGNYRDPALFDMSAITAELIQRQDYEMRFLVENDSVKTAESMEVVNRSLNFCFEQVNREINYIIDDDSVAFFTKSKDAEQEINAYIHRL